MMARKYGVRCPRGEKIAFWKAVLGTMKGTAGLPDPNVVGPTLAGDQTNEAGPD